MLWIVVPVGMVSSGRALPGLMSALGTRLDRVADLETLRRDDVALLAVGVVQQRDARRAVRVVLDVRHPGRHAVLVALEVDHPVAALVAAALVTRGDAAVVVAAALARDRLDERALRLGPRDVVEGLGRHEAAAGGGRLVVLDAHYLPSKNSILSVGESCTTAFFQAALRPGRPAAPLGLGPHVRGRHAEDLDVEELLDRLGDHRLVRLRVHLEGVPMMVDLRVALLGDDRPDDDLFGFDHGHAPVRTESAFSVTTMERLRSTCSTERRRASPVSA